MIPWHRLWKEIFLEFVFSKKMSGGSKRGWGLSCKLRVPYTVYSVREWPIKLSQLFYGTLKHSQFSFEKFVERFQNWHGKKEKDDSMQLPERWCMQTTNHHYASRNSVWMHHTLPSSLLLWAAAATMRAYASISHMSDWRCQLFADYVNFRKLCGESNWNS